MYLSIHLTCYLVRYSKFLENSFDNEKIVTYRIFDDSEANKAVA